MIFTAFTYACVFIPNRAEGKLSTKNSTSWHSPFPMWFLYPPQNKVDYDDTL